MLNRQASGRTNLWQISHVPWVVLLQEEVSGLEVQESSFDLNMNKFSVFERAALNIIGDKSYMYITTRLYIIHLLKS